MTSLTALMLATPLFGMSLHVDPAVLTQPAVNPAYVDGIDSALTLQVPFPAKLEPSGDVTTADLVRKRAKIGNAHKWIGIATWSMMTLTVISGIIQFYNKYGWWDGQGSNPCVTGNAVFGQDQCRGTPAFHLSMAVITGALYFTAFGMSFTMPDPLGVSEGSSRRSRRLRTHKKLRWAHFSGMVAQILLGVVIANPEAFGLNRANDYNTLKALSTVHLATGLFTYGALTWAGSIMIF